MIDCTPTYAIESPALGASVASVLGIISAATGVRFRLVGMDDAPQMTYSISADTIASLGPVNAYYDGDRIVLAPHAYGPRYRTYLLLHESLHWVGMNHNRRPASVMNLAHWPTVPVLRGWDYRTARALTAHCR